MRRIAIINQKGGTGKTATAVNLSAGLALKGQKVLLVDLDPQGNLGVWFGLTPTQSLYHLLVEGVPATSCIVSLKENLDLLPSTQTAAQAEMLMSSQPAREGVLKRRLSGLQGYDYVLLDCAPSLNLLNQNAATFCEEAFVPVSMEYLSLVGVRQILENLSRVREVQGHAIDLTLVIPTFYDVRNRKSHEILDSLKKHFQERVADPIRSNVRLSEAASYHQDIFAFDPKSYGAQDYSRLVERVISMR